MAAFSSSLYATTTLRRPSAQEVLVDMEEMMMKTTERLSHVSTRPTPIQRFPHNMRSIGGADGYYVVPILVAIGPYHHGVPHLQEMEEVKHVVAYQFCTELGHSSVKVVYEKIFSAAGYVRSCYTAIEHLSDAEFAKMMFLDGCFLLMSMIVYDKPPLLGLMLSSFPTFVRDFLLLENQIPWLVLQVLMEYVPRFPLEVVLEHWTRTVMNVYFLDTKQKKIPPWILWLKKSVRTCLMKCCCRGPKAENNTDTEGGIKSQGESSRPQHLLGLLRFSMLSGMPADQREGKNTPNSLLQLSSSAVYLAQIGVQLTPSTVGWFADVKVQKKLVLGELSLSPLFLNDIVASILVNMAALEVVEANNSSSTLSDGFVVSSYLSMLVMLMNREEDVQQLREKGLLCSHFSNMQTLAFFKGLGQHLRLGFNYFKIVLQIEEYIRRRPLRIAAHRFLYNNCKLVAAILSIASVLVGIFKALYSLKQS